MVDYQGNANKDKDKEIEKPEKKIERVVTSEVIVQKKSVGRKFKDLFVEADFKSVVRYIMSDVLLPAARNTIVDVTTKGIERMMYGESAMRRRMSMGRGSHFSYQTPVSRGYGGSPLRSAPPVPISQRSRSVREEFILSSREEADMVIENMNNIIEQYEVVSVADLNSLVGFPTSHVDNKWGWTFLGDIQIRQVREGYLIDLPAAEAI